MENIYLDNDSYLCYLEKKNQIRAICIERLGKERGLKLWTYLYDKDNLKKVSDYNLSSKIVIIPLNMFPEIDEMTVNQIQSIFDDIAKETQLMNQWHIGMIFVCIGLMSLIFLRSRRELIVILANSFWNGLIIGGFLVIVTIFMCIGLGRKVFELSNRIKYRSIPVVIEKK